MKYSLLKIKHLRDFGALGTKRLDTNKETFSLKTIAHEVISILRGRESPNSVDFSFKLSRKGIKILVSEKERIK